MSNDLKQGFVYFGFLIAGFSIGALVYGLLDGSEHQVWVSYTLMAIGGFVCAWAAER